MECVVQGIIETQHVEALEVLLQGLCGVPKQRVRVHELCLKSGPNIISSEVRLLCDLAQPTPTWSIRHIGGALRGAGDQLSVLVRTVTESKVSNSVLRFFYAIGYKLDHEVLKTGFSFKFESRGAQLTVSVTSANRMPRLHATDEAVPITPGIQLVELTAPAAAENYTDVVAAITAFSEYLSPLLHLSKPGVSSGIVPNAAAAAASLMSSGGSKAVL